MDDITYCTAHNCPQEDKCARKVNLDEDDINQCCCNLGVTCCEESGFESFIPRYIERKILCL